MTFIQLFLFSFGFEHKGCSSLWPNSNAVGIISPYGYKSQIQGGLNPPTSVITAIEKEWCGVTPVQNSELLVCRSVFEYDLDNI